MASVTLPTSDDVLQACGLADYLQLDADLDQQVTALLDHAEAECAIAVGEALYDSSTLTARKALLLARAVTYRAGALLLVNPMVRRALGTHEPILAEDSSQFQELIDSLVAKAQEVEGLVMAGTEASAATAPFRLPSFGASTFTVSSSDRSPSELNDLTDTSDDISANDTEHG